MAKQDDRLVEGSFLLFFCMLYAGCHGFSEPGWDASGNDVRKDATMGKGSIDECYGTDGSHWDRQMSNRLDEGSEIRLSL